MFIPKDKRDNSNRGFAFVRFATIREAERAVAMAEGRVCGGWKLQANLAKFCPNIKKRRGEESSKRDWKNFRQSSFWHEEHHMGEVQDQRSKQEEEERLAGWIVEEDKGKGVRVAQWVVKEQKRSVFNSLVGFLKANSVSIDK